MRCSFYVEILLPQLLFKKSLADQKQNSQAHFIHGLHYIFRILERKQKLFFVT